MYVRTGVLVTNLGVHFKHGRENSLVWVTTLDRGKPVAGAEVAVNDCNGQPLWSGRTDANGLARVDARLRRRSPTSCLADDGLFVTARNGRRQGRRPTSPSSSAAGRRASSPGASTCPPASGAAARRARPHGVRPHAAARRRDGVDEALRARRDLERAWPLPAAETCPTQLKIVHEGSGQEFVQPLQLERHAQRACRAGTSRPPPSSACYDVVLRTRARRPRRRARSAAGTAATSASRSSACRWSMRASAARRRVPVAPAELPLGVQLNYFSGGGMAQAPLRAIGAAARARRRLRRATTSSASSRRATWPTRRARATTDDAAARRRQARRRQAAADAPTATAPRASR